MGSVWGCRAYLSEWVNPKTGKAVTIGRANIGAVSLNLPMIYQDAKVSCNCGEDVNELFYKNLDHCMDVIREFLKKRYAYVASMPCSSNPMAFTQGGVFGGTKDPDEPVGDIVNTMTASFGITALHELTVLACGKTLRQTNEFAKEVVEHIRQRVLQYKKEDGYLYALYGTPAESLCMTQAKQFYERFGEVEGISKNFFTNSFHCHVSEKITPIEKQDLEEELFHMVEGGHIQYVRLDNPSNLEATRTIILRGLKKGFYQGVNFDAVFCNDCHESSTNSFQTCPKCGSTNILVQSRICGLT